MIIVVVVVVGAGGRGEESCAQLSVKKLYQGHRAKCHGEVVGQAAGPKSAALYV